MNDPTGILIRICGIRAQNEGAEVLLSILLSNRESEEKQALLLTMEQYLELKPQKGEISEACYERLYEASQICQALRCGERLLSYGPSPADALTRKIMQHGFPKQIALAATEKICRMGLIDEAGMLRREVEKCVKKMWGERRIRAFLWTKGFGEAALGSLSDLCAEIDFPELCAALIQKHYGGIPKNPEERQRMNASLSRYGYSVGDIREATRMLSARPY